MRPISSVSDRAMYASNASRSSGGAKSWLMVTNSSCTATASVSWNGRIWSSNDRIMAVCASDGLVANWLGTGDMPLDKGLSYRKVGSSRSRTQSPIKLTASVVSESTAPGNTAIHQAFTR